MARKPTPTRAGFYKRRRLQATPIRRQSPEEMEAALRQVLGSDPFTQVAAILQHHKELATKVVEANPRNDWDCDSGAGFAREELEQVRVAELVLRAMQKAENYDWARGYIAGYGLAVANTQTRIEHVLGGTIRMGLNSREVGRLAREASLKADAESMAGTRADALAVAVAARAANASTPTASIIRAIRTRISASLLPGSDLQIRRWVQAWEKGGCLPTRAQKLS